MNIILIDISPCLWVTPEMLRPHQTLLLWRWILDWLRRSYCRERFAWFWCLRSTGPFWRRFQTHAGILKPGCGKPSERNKTILLTQKIHLEGHVLISCIHFENKGQMNIQQNILHKNINYVIKISDFITFHHYQILPDKKTHI